MLGISLGFILLVVVLGIVVAYKWALRATHLDENEGPEVRTISGGRVKRVRQRPDRGATGMA